MANMGNVSNGNFFSASCSDRIRNVKGKQMFTAILNFFGIRTARQKAITERRSNAAKLAWAIRKNAAPAGTEPQS